MNTIARVTTANILDMLHEEVSSPAGYDATTITDFESEVLDCVRFMHYHFGYSLVNFEMIDWQLRPELSGGQKWDMDLDGMIYDALVELRARGLVGFAQVQATIWDPEEREYYFPVGSFDAAAATERVVTGHEVVVVFGSDW
jgi:hypothetical protein